MVGPCSSKIFTNRLKGTAEDFGDAASVRRERGWRLADSRKIRIGSRGSRPEVEQRLNARNGGSAGCEVRHKGGGRLVKMLPESLVVPEEKSLIEPDRATNRGPKLIALKGRRIAPIEEVRGVKGVVPQELKDRAMQLVCARLS